MNENEVAKALVDHVRSIAKLEKDLADAEIVMRRLKLDLNDQGVSIVLAGVEHRVTRVEYLHRGGVIAKVLPGADELHAICLKLQHNHILSLKSQIEGRRFRLKQEAAKV